MNKRYQKRWSEAINQRRTDNYCLSCFDLWLLIISFLYLLFIVLSVFFYLRLLIISFGIFCSLYCLSYFDLRLQIISFGIFCSLYCMSYFELRLLIISFWYLLFIVLSVLLWITASDHLFLVSFIHCIVCPTLIYGFWSSLLVSFVHCIVCPTLNYASDHLFLVSFVHCIVCFFLFTLLIISFGIFVHCKKNKIYQKDMIRSHK
jgi:hypothetical protein